MSKRCEYCGDVATQEVRDEYYPESDDLAWMPACAQCPKTLEFTGSELRPLPLTAKQRMRAADLYHAYRNLRRGKYTREAMRVSSQLMKEFPGVPHEAIQSAWREIYC